MRCLYNLMSLVLGQKPTVIHQGHPPSEQIKLNIAGDHYDEQVSFTRVIVPISTKGRFMLKGLTEVIVDRQRQTNDAEKKMWKRLRCIVHGENFGTQEISGAERFQVELSKHVLYITHSGGDKLSTIRK